MLFKLLAKLSFFIHKLIRRVKMHVYKFAFKNAGKNFVFDPNDSFSYSTISVGDYVFIGPGAKFSASVSSIIIGNKVMFGPNVTMMGGDHNTTQIGRFMYDVHEKLPENDIPIVIEDDCWIGAGAIILKGVTIGTGTIVAAGAVVTRSTLPYSIVAGNPAHLIKMRFEGDELERHIKLLGES